MICGNLRCLAEAARLRQQQVWSPVWSWCRLNAVRRGLSGTGAVNSSKKKPKNPNKFYSETLNLPKSQFPMKHSRTLELELEKRTQFSDLYKDELLPEHQIGTPKRTFILHDGPPYANGDAHFGHCINKTLKDIFLKRQLLAGNVDLHYIPGWDCHGLPIELKALTEDQAQQLSPLEVRSQARQLATSAIDRQRTSFARWYLQGDLHQPYRTFDLSYSLTELEAFYRLYAVDGLIYRDLMPVYWSPSTRTALAEAELQYNPEHISLAAYIRFEVLGFEDDHPRKTYALIWTTTPWTLLANEGVAFSETLDYSLITGLNSSATENDHQYLVATELVPILREKIPNNSIRVFRSGITGDQLSTLKYRDPLNPDHLKPFLAFENVSLGKGGTGLVHLAPNHGFDDYKLFQTYSLKKRSSVVDGLGRLILPGTDEPPIPIATTDNRASKVVLDRLLTPLQAVVHASDHQHSYPYDWRSSQPVLIRPSSQWFLRIEGPLRDACLQALDRVQLYPEKMRREFRHQLATRPNWCLSRQRYWGVPIPVFYEADGKDPDRLKPILDEKIFQRVMDTFRREGSLDVWWSRSAQELVGPDFAGKSPLVKGEDILDIWFDSGCSWLAVLPKTKQGLVQADLYSEGVDQIRGWFQSSLITSVALQGTAPYRAVFIHGFALDREGRKMSKSVGNVVDPNDIVEDRDLGKYILTSEEDYTEEIPSKKWSKKKPMKKSSKSNGSCGLDGLRLWIAKHACSHNDVPVNVTAFSEDILSTLNRLRNTFRFLLGVLGPPNNTGNSLFEHHQYCQLPLMDRYLLMRVAAFQKLADSAYRDYALGELVEGGVLKTVLHEVATFYLSRVKDRLYCDPPKNLKESSVGGYQAAWTVLWAVYHTAGYVLAPITPHLVLEANEKLPFMRRELLLKEEDSVDDFVKELFSQEGGPQSEEEFTRWMAPGLRMIETLNRWAGTATPSHRLMEYDLVVGSEDIEVLRTLKFLQSNSQRTFTSDLVELLQVASVRYQEGLFDDLGEEDGLKRYRLRPIVEVQEEVEGEATLRQVESTEFELELWPTTLLLCDRCRRHTVWPGEKSKEDEDCLCDRCSAVLKSA